MAARLPPAPDAATVPEPNPSAPERSEFLLRVTQGPDAGATLRVSLSDPQRVLVGTSEACTLRLSDPAVSRRHLALELTPQGLKLVDLDSTNGTRVDRVRVREALLEGEEQVSLGGTVLLVEAEPQRAAPVPQGSGFGKLLGASEAMRRLYPLCERLARSDVPVVIEGETGTGKEVLAEALHELGPRAKGPFEVFDCTAVPPQLVEAELFGHERGAFTGAVAQRKGVFELAEGGTLLIDEIGDFELALQSRLLRALERSEVRRVGGTKWMHVDVRVIAATRRDLDREVQEGRFRDDLFHRLAVGRIELPPLRDRPDDIELLARQFWRESGGQNRPLPADVLARWRAASWPGNVRELRNAVARLYSLGEAVVPGGLGPEPTDPLEHALELPFVPGRDFLVADFERRYVERVLAKHGGDVSKAAEASGIGLRYLQKIRARHR
jgi:DNA-binding NtrC family response regulator